jgi:hypothetical protein
MSRFADIASYMRPVKGERAAPSGESAAAAEVPSRLVPPPRRVWSRLSSTFFDHSRPSTFFNLLRPSSPPSAFLGPRPEVGGGRGRSRKVGEGRGRSGKVEEGRGRSGKVGEGRQSVATRGEGRVEYRPRSAGAMPERRLERAPICSTVWLRHSRAPRTVPFALPTVAVSPGTCSAPLGVSSPPRLGPAPSWESARGGGGIGGRSEEVPGEMAAVEREVGGGWG